MTTGIVILGIVAVLLFFGAAERYFDRLGITSWLTFLIVLALIIGAVVPEVRTDSFVMTVGGFAVPAVAFVLIFVLAVRGGGSVLRILLALASETALVVAFRMMTGAESEGAVTVFFLLSGFIGGSVCCAVAGTRAGSIAAVLGGCIAGDAVSMAVLRGAYGQTVYTLGGYGIFNAMIIGCASALVFAEITGAVRRASENRRIAAERLNAESAADEGITGGGEERSDCTQHSDDDIIGGD